MKRLDAIKVIESMAVGEKCDLSESSIIYFLTGFKTEVRHLCIGCKAFSELYDILEQVTSLNKKDCIYVKDGIFLDLTSFFDLGGAKDIVKESLDGVDIDLLSNAEAMNLLARLASFEPMEKFIELLVGYPVWMPRGSYDERMGDPKFFAGRKDDYNYVATVLNADNDTVHGTLKWLQEHIF